MLIGIDGEGIVAYDISKKSIANTDFYIDNINIKKSKVHSLLTDSSNNLWIGIYQKGVAFIPSQANMFNYIGNFSSIRNYIGSNCITALCETTDKGKLIVGTDNDGIYLLDKNYNFIQHLTQDKNPDVPPTVMCLFEDSNKKVWIGSYLSGISLFDSQTNKLSKTSLRNNEGNEITKVYRFVEDPHKRLWIGTMGTGLYYVDLPASSASYSDQKVHQALSEKEINQWINTLLYIPNGRLYIGTYDGIKCIDTEKLKVVGKEKVLIGLSINTIAQGPDDHIWAGTPEGIYVPKIRNYHPIHD